VKGFFRNQPPMLLILAGYCALLFLLAWLGSLLQ